MCTVTFVPTKTGIRLTSNRDEHYTRGKAIKPRKLNGMTYPADKDAGGSWMVLKENGDAGVLLNGAFEKHLPAPPYRKSRGLVFLEIMRAPSLIGEVDLSGIEPFTVVIYAAKKLYECRWDGHHKYLSPLDVTVPHIWSSATLYDKATMRERETLFEAWLQAGGTIADFHRSMIRQGEISTVSITSIRIDGTAGELKYEALKPAPLYLKRFLIRFFNWEYWPFHVVYAPLYLYWIWLSLKARSFFFFATANPLIHNGGFLLERKKMIYDMMPPDVYPQTILCKHGALLPEAAKLTFPLIAKPDIGQRGLQVKLLQSMDELIAYAAQSRTDFLLQEYIDHAYEAGIFYYRIPGEKKGHISGVVGKEFLAVVGDGYSTIEALLLKEDRFVLQLPALMAAYGQALYRTLPAGEYLTLVPYGNHSRGAKFIDLSYKINEELVETIDALCRQIPEFYYGRLDIKYSSWDDLCAGRNFSVIELNGAGSEPTHIYDPAHSIFFAWKEVLRHWRLLYKISKLNARRNGIRGMDTVDGLRMLKENARYIKMLSGDVAV